MLEPSRNRANSCWKRKTGLEKKLIAGGAVVTVIAVVFAILYFLKRPCGQSEDECTSRYCVTAASELLDFIDLKEDPCTNFYRYVCGSYYKHAIKKNYPSPFNKVNKEFENEMKAIIVDPIKKKDTNANVLVKQFYHECMNETKIDKDQNRAFIKAINELGGWPLLNGSNWNMRNFSWIEFHKKSKELGLPIFGFFTLTRVDSTENDTVLNIAGPSDKSTILVGKQKYNSAMKEILEALGVTDFRQNENEEVLAFMEELRKYQKQTAMKDDLKGILKQLLAFIPQEEEQVGAIEDLIEACPSVPWLNLLNSFAAKEVVFDNSSEVAFGSIKDYCDSLGKLIKSTDPRTIANYYVWSIIHQTYQYLSRDIRNAYWSIKGKYFPRHEVCFAEADNRFKYVKETIYVRDRTPKVVKEQLTEMIDIIKEVFIDHLKVCDWMDQITKEAAIEKAELIQNVIGAEDDLYDVERFDKVLGVDGLKFTSDNMFEMAQQRRLQETHHFFRTLYGPQGENWASFFKNAVELNAFFVQALNIMILPAPILSSIFYNHKLPAFMNYGSIGRVIGHEIMHGFEKSGREVILQNDELIDWWTNATADAYDKKVQCAIDAFEKIPFRYRLNGTLTLDENLSDFVGIDVAYESYLKYIEKHGAEKKLPGIPLTPKQIFWIQTGTFLCFRKLDDDATDYEDEDVHAFPAFRVQGGARHSKHFAKDFNCPEGSFMNPKDKCRIL